MIKPLLFGLITCMLSSCASVYYPSHINSSFIENKGESNAGGAASLTSINLQASTAVSDHFRLAAGVNYWGWSVTIGDATVGNAGLQSQFLAGYYTKLGNSVYFEGYGGIGGSFIEADFLSHAIIQPSFGFGKDAPKFIVSLRSNYLNNALFSDPNDGVELAPGETNLISGFFHDVGFTHRFYKQNKYLFLQYGLSNDVEKYGDNEAIPFINFGINFSLFKRDRIPNFNNNED